MQRLPDQIRRLLLKADKPGYQTRLYLAMLAERGNPSDCDWLEQQLAVNNGQKTLAQWIAAYLMLKGEPGLDLVDREYLSKTGNVRERFLQTYFALSALRCVRDHPSISKERLARSTLRSVR